MSGTIYKILLILVILVACSKPVEKPKEFAFKKDPSFTKKDGKFVSQRQQNAVIGAE